MEHFEIHERLHSFLYPFIGDRWWLDNKKSVKAASTLAVYLLDLMADYVTSAWTAWGKVVWRHKSNPSCTSRARKL
jgi:hypothetical protein